MLLAARPAYPNVLNVDVQAADGRRSAYDPDEVEEEARDRDRRRRINAEWRKFTERVASAWEKDHPRLSLEWETPFRCARGGAARRAIGALSDAV